MNKVMLFLGVVVLMIASWLHQQNNLGFYDGYVWTMFAIILSYFVIRAVLTSK